jgi:pyridoxal phosphate enzyme (YggS family)
MIANRLAAIREQIASYESQYGRDRGSVTLLAVSKKQSQEKIQTAYEAGQYAFGENYLQEALIKMTALSHLNIEWHFIGPIQSNKTRKIAEHFHWVQSIDSLKIATRLNDQRPAHLPPLNICLEINLHQETTKSGLAPDEVLPLAQACRALSHLRLRGLMTIPAPTSSLTVARENFHRMHSLWQQLNDAGCDLDTLSMGMSNDFEAAIAEGSTLVRLGTAVFGERS